MSRNVSWHLLSRALLVACLPLACSVHRADVTRTMDGRTEDGRYIAPEAYAWYGRGAYHEARQQWRIAEHAFVTALGFDPASAEIWTRIAAVRCHDPNQDSSGSFERAEALDPSYAPLHFERARCLLRQRKFAAAERSAMRAMELDPNRQETSLLVADVLQALGHHTEARRWRFAHVARWPYAPGLSRTSTRLANADAGLNFAASQTQTGRQTALRHALERGDLGEARKLAIELHIPSGTLAVQAAVVGAEATALKLRSEVLAADPSNSDALVAGLVTVTDGAFSQALQRLSAWDAPGRPRIALSPLGVLWVAQVLARHGNDEAAAAWLAGMGPLPTPSDPIEADLANELRTISGSAFRTTVPSRQGEPHATSDSRIPADPPKWRGSGRAPE